MALAVMRIDAEDGLLRFLRGVRAAAVPLGLLACLATAAMTPFSDELGYSFYNTLMAFAFACLLALVVLPTGGERPSLLVRVLETRPFVWAGLISYSVFLWHEPLVHWLEGHGLTAAGAIGLGANTLLLLALTAVLSSLTYRWVKLPALRRKVGVRRERGILDVPTEQVEGCPVKSGVRDGSSGTSLRDTARAKRMRVHVLESDRRAGRIQLSCASEGPSCEHP
jgi:peptidoglycan/LPS O-acetylase OafA/YrhL